MQYRLVAFVVKAKLNHLSATWRPRTGIFFGRWCGATGEGMARPLLIVQNRKATIRAAAAPRPIETYSIGRGAVFLSRPPMNGSRGCRRLKNR